MGGVALFDLDRTLIDCNSGRLWVQEEWRVGNVGTRDAVWAGWWLGRYSLGWEDGLEGVFEAAVERLAGTEERALDARVRDWFHREVAHRARPGGLAALKRHKEAGDRLVVCTSSSTYAAAAAAAHWGFDEAIATRFEVVDGRFTGRVAAHGLGARKLDRAREWAAASGVRLEDCAFYTDSHTDLPLLEAVGRPVVVHPDRALARVAAARGWAVVDWGTSATR